MADLSPAAQQIFNQYVAAHGALKGPAYATDPTIAATEPVMAAGVDTGQTHSVTKPNGGQ